MRAVESVAVPSSRLAAGSPPRLSPNATANVLLRDDEPIHDWYRFVLAYPPHLVRTYLDKFGLDADDTVLDPFCGTGTTVIECGKAGIPSLGVEGHPFTHFAAAVKSDWSPDPLRLRTDAEQIATTCLRKLEEDGVPDHASIDTWKPRQPRTKSLQTLPENLTNLLLTDSISPLPLHKVLLLRDQILAHGNPAFLNHERLALAKVAVFGASNLGFGPEVGLGPIKKDAPVIEPWLASVRKMASDIAQLHQHSSAPPQIFLGDSRQIGTVIKKRRVSAVITSPPYPNEKDYTRTTRLESVLLGFVSDRESLRTVKRGLVRSNTRGVYKQDDDDLLVAENQEIQEIAERIEKRRIELGKTSGFERMFPRLTRLYFGGMQRHLADLRKVLLPGAQLAYVVGDQASYLRVMIRTGELLENIAKSLGYEVLGRDLFRTRLATATREHLREEVLVLRWPGEER
ncbi:MAG TPA: DNA methyltransferase [Thermoplasmata archaeon]|nr:DNA methyltransferase [Thermoplasmata archaeon]